MATTFTELELSQAPEIMLGGKAFKVLPIVARQNRIITPRVMSMLPLFTQAVTSAQIAKQAGLGAFSFDLTEAEFDKLIDIAHAAIWRAHPEVTRDNLLDMPIKAVELFSMLEVVAKQAGIVPEKVEPLPGLGGAPLAVAATTAEQTGTQSSPRSPSEQDGPSTTSSTP